MNRYKITNTVTGEVKEAESEYLGTAITALGWKIEECSCEIISGTAVKKKRGRPAKVKPPADEAPPAKQEEVPPVPKELIEKARQVGEADQAEEAAIDKFNKKLDKEIEGIDIHALKGDATEAEKTAYSHKQQIETIAIEAEAMFLRMGQLLYNARIAGEWSILHYESYREYIEDLKLPMTNSYSWATRLSAIYEYLVKNMKLDEKLLAEIGVAKLTRLLPLARKGELTEDIIEAARVLSDLDLRESLGHSVGGETEEMWIVCPRCGERLDAKRATRG